MDEYYDWMRNRGREKFELWKVMIGWEENVGREVIFWDKFWRLKIIIFWDRWSINLVLKIYKSSFLHVALLETGVDLSPVTLDSL